MCLAIPSKIISLDRDTAVIEVFGARREVNTMLLLETPRLGDYVLVHAGFAIQTIDADVVRSGEVMQEYSLAQSILDVAAEQCGGQGCTVVEAIRVRLGAATGVRPEALGSAFDELKGNTPAKDAVLNIELVPAGGTCRACGGEVGLVGAGEPAVCPRCGSTDMEDNGGREMEITGMELH
jgi:hydrogenase assembly chaperone HypC/HupF